MSQRAPGYRFQYQVPPTSPASSSTAVLKPALRNRCRRYRPANPAPTTATSTCCVVPLAASETRAATIASGMPSSRASYFAVGYCRAPSLSSRQFHIAARAATDCSTGATWRDVRERQHVTMWNPLRNARSKAHYGLRSDIAALPKSAKASHRVAAAPNPTESTASELQDPQN